MGFSNIAFFWDTLHMAQWYLLSKMLALHTYIFSCYEILPTFRTCFNYSFKLLNHFCRKIVFIQRPLGNLLVLCTFKKTYTGFFSIVWSHHGKKQCLWSMHSRKDMTFDVVLHFLCNVKFKWASIYKSKQFMQFWECIYL